MSELEGKVDDLDKMSKEYEKFRNWGKEHRKCGVPPEDQVFKS